MIIFREPDKHLIIIVMNFYLTIPFLDMNIRDWDYFGDFVTLSQYRLLGFLFYITLVFLLYFKLHCNFCYKNNVVYFRFSKVVPFTYITYSKGRLQD